MENSGPYDSFQHELEDYIRKQKARGLQPEVCFRKVTEDSAYRAQGHTASQPLSPEQGLLLRGSHKHPSPYKRLRTVGSWLPPWSKAHQSRQRPESLHPCQKPRDHFFRNPWLSSPLVQGEADSRPREEGTSLRQVADAAPGWKRRSWEGAGEGQDDQEQAGWNRKHRCDGDSHRDSRRAEVEPLSTEGPRHRNNSNQGGDATKDRRRSPKEKKRPGKASTQEMDLWDEAILGSCS
nr:lysine-rich coiled-coil protein 1-like [Manis javanica]